ncbi:MAG: hypothetical protein ACKVOU_08880 [Cytophagales bacterium]
MKKEPKLTSKALAAKAAEEAQLKLKDDTKRIKSFPPDVWKKIENWGRVSETLSNHLQNCCFTISGRVRRNTPFEGLEVQNGIKILEVVAEKAPELLVFEPLVSATARQFPQLEMSIPVLTQVVLWDKKNKKLKNISYTFMADLALGRKPLSDQNKKIASWNVDIAQKCGFVFNPTEEAVLDAEIITEVEKGQES